jgi:nickel/cobalt exporter
MTPELAALTGTAAAIGFLHALIGPDHYVPFIAMARAREWTATRTAAVTAACGVGHVLGSIGLGAIGIALGLALGGLEWIEGMRGQVASWLLIGFGLAYVAWGLRRAARSRPHTHWHEHGDGTVHRHRHVHRGSHAHVHEARSRAESGLASGADGPPSVAGQITPWILFTIFVFGPCEPLIPILMYPAAEGSWWGVGLVALVFGVATIATMLAAVLIGYRGLARLPFGRLEPYSHTIAGAAIVACGVAIQLGF